MGDAVYSDNQMKGNGVVNSSTYRGVMWSMAERFSVQGVRFAVMLVIARILTPDDFGLVGMLAIFIGIANSLTDCGFSQALIRKQNRTPEDISTSFYFNFVSSCVIYLLLYIIAPWVSEFYSEPALCELMRVLCLGVVISSFGVVQRALLIARIDFKTLAKVSLTASIISGATGIFFAIEGYGVWTLVWQQLVNDTVSTLLLFKYSCWQPQRLLSKQSFKELFPFGYKLMMSGLINTVFDNIYQLFIGRLFSAGSLGNYVQAQNFSILPSANISNIIQRVTYPVMCTMQDETERIKAYFLKILRATAFVCFPMMTLLGAVAYPMVVILLGDKWVYAATLLVPLCFSMMWTPIHSLNLNLLQVAGRTDLFLRLEIIKKIIGVTFLLITIPLGLTIMCYGQIVNSVICLYINTYYTGKLYNLGWLVQMKSLAYIFIASLMAFSVSTVIVRLIMSEYLQLLAGLAVGLSVYMLSSLIFKVNETKFILSLIRKK